ncbi:hypothetical protein SAMN05421547_14614 [Delftia lacustris]|uniref:Uncharacterized protein n=1 Tax=Delftia lacustris TaxID=558537 RepID=A0A1H3UI16_9BURK|nr:hypothetical protein SAMN05421547_14614 [Delftia lacustris]
MGIFPTSRCHSSSLQFISIPSINDATHIRNSIKENNLEFIGYSDETGNLFLLKQIYSYQILGESYMQLH